MTIHSTLADWIGEKRKTKLNDILRQMVIELHRLHSQGTIHGNLTPWNVLIHSTTNNVELTNNEDREESKEWRPAEEKDSPPTCEGDVFSLGCLFYYVLTGGQHPFGRSGQRHQLINYHLFDLSGCRDEQQRKIISQMINYDAKQRPNCDQLLAKNPFLWTTEKMSDFLKQVAENEEITMDLGETVLVSESKDSNEIDIESIANLLHMIKTGKETPSNLLKKYSDLFSTVYQTKTKNDLSPTNRGQNPECFYNLLVANLSFAEVSPSLGIHRRPGRFGNNYVHVLQYEQSNVSTSLKRIRHLNNHVNVLQSFYLVENFSNMTLMAVEPFDETLESWMADGMKKMNIELAKEILIQVTNGLAFFHLNQLIHGNLSIDQIVLDRSTGSFIAKISKLKFDELVAVSFQDDIRALGRIYSYLLEGIDDRISHDSSNHLIKCMSNSNDKFVPSCEALFYHPFFWLPEEMKDFCEISRAYQAVRSQSESIVMTWLKLQKVEGCDVILSDLESFYHHSYTFPTIEQMEGFPENSSSPQNIDLPLEANRVAIKSSNVIVSTERAGPIVESFTGYVQKLIPSTEDTIKNYLNMCVQKLSAAKLNTRHSAVRLLGRDEQGRTALHIACSFDSFYTIVDCLIVFGADIDEPDNNGYAPLHVAVFSKSIKIAQLLIDRKANVNVLVQHSPLYFALGDGSEYLAEYLIGNLADPLRVDNLGRTALHIAVLNNAYKMVELLLNYVNVNHPDDEGNSPLCMAVNINSLEMTELLLHYDANPNHIEEMRPIFLAIANQSFDMVFLLKRYGADVTLTGLKGGTALHQAASIWPQSENLMKIIDWLIAEKVDCNATDVHGHSALHVATLNQAENVVERLLKSSKIDLELKNNEKKMTALHMAAFNGCQSIVKMLIQSKANVEAKDINGETPLEYAVSVDADDVVKLLMQAGAKVKSKRWKRRSPLHVAASHNSLKVAKLLIEEGVDVNATDEYGFTPLHYAYYRKNMEFVKFLHSIPGINRDPESEKLGPSDLQLVHGLTNGFIKVNNVLPHQLPQIHQIYQQVNSHTKLRTNITITQTLKLVPYSN